MTAAAAPPGGRVTIVGIGPGDAATCTPEVTAALAEATDLVGYGPYLDMAAALAPPAGARHASDNREEGARARHALDLAAAGGRVVVVSSGDPGVFAMATAVLEQLDDHPGSAAVAGGHSQGWDGVEVVVMPGVTAAQAAAARAGAPLGHDFCVVSLSDNLKPWAVVERRLTAAAAADFVIALYNPVSRHRPWQFGRAVELLAAHRGPSTPVVLGRDVGRPAESVRVVTLADLPTAPVDMRTVVIVGSSTTRTVVAPTGELRVYTPRHYDRTPAPG